MHTWLATSQELIGDTQLVLGVIVLVIVLIDLYVSGRLRRALDFPPVPPNVLTGSHLLFVLIAFLLAVQIFAYGLSVLGYGPACPASQPAAATAPSTEPGTSEAARPQTARAWDPEAVPASEPATSSSTAVADDDAGEPGDAVAASQPEEAEDGSPATRPESSHSEEAHDEPIRLVGQGLAEIIAIGVMLYVVHITFVGGRRGLGLRGDRLRWDLGWAIAAYLAFWPACALVAEISTRLYQLLISREPNEHQVLLLLESPDLSLGWQIVAWTLAGLVAPFFEELLFRGLLLTWLRKVTQSTWLAIVLSGLAFGIIHMPQWHLVPALSLLGIFAGYLYARTGSLTLVILMHAIFNTRTLVMLEVARSQS